MKEIMGYVVVDSNNKRAYTKRAVYDSKAAASSGFSHITRTAHRLPEEHKYLKGKTLREQTEYRVVGLVIADE